MKRIIIHGLRPEYNGFIAAVRYWPMQSTLVELENLLANQEALAKQMGSITLNENDEEEALFIRKKGPPRGQGEAKEWTRGGRCCPKKSSYSEGAQQESEDEDQQDLMERRRKRGITIEDDEAYFVEDLTTSNTPSSDKDEVEEEEEWDMEEGFSIEVRDPNLSNDLVFENARDEDWEALPNDEEDVEYEIEPLYQEDKEVQENVEVIDGALAAQEDTQVHCAVKKTQEASNKNWRMRKKPNERYMTTAAQVTLPYKEVAKGQAWRRSKKKEELHNSEKNEELRMKSGPVSSPQRQEKEKARNGRAQKIQASMH
ncbi:hypothetical protein PR202_ga31462 [Eleusine coracana subsp. coracana]|uniref:Uncharacterized protein n=1 Tax=Eleusine coracana subsp. coracana TaxID=191504 RepID=A0AAV5DSD2_ELECO|nr:hypothetical protein PR202_ga31462 [Eleusine coracana subsp. coracana]